MQLLKALVFFLVIDFVSSVTNAEVARTNFDLWLASFNSGEKETIQTFYAKHLGDPDALTARNLSEETCGFGLASVEHESDRSFSALLRQRCFPALFRLSFAVAEDGQTLEEFRLQPFAMPEKRALLAIQDIADRLAKADSFAGAMILACDSDEP